MSCRVLVFVIAMLLSACAPTRFVEQAEKLAPGKGIVFGKVTVVQKGKELKWGGFFGSGSFNLILLPDGTNEASAFNLKEDGTFYWTLAPGNYRVLAYDWVHGPTRSGRINARFTVPKGREHVYIGNLGIFMTDGQYRYAVKDDYDSAVEKFRKRFPSANGALKKTLLTFEKPPGSYSRMLSICSKFWGIDECDRDHQGLVSITPEASEKFPIASSLTPKFEWKPSSRDDVTYDFVIYEAATKMYAIREYTPGRVAIYEENLKQPKFELKQPLKPSQKYYWSVRLRHGQDVSSWSRHGYFSFFVIGSASGYGLWFTFETPKVGS
jgi:hypothetical protein